MSAPQDRGQLQSPFPTDISSLYFNDAQATPSLYSTLKALKKSTLSIPNRLRSILADAAYITHNIHPQFPTYPLLANERCGSWYIPPTLKSGSAYFKSTDGHHGQWDFSLRRLNLQVLAVLGEHGGAVLVDSTRRGKRMPDALRRTVPVWVAVWNRVLFPEIAWAQRLQHPGLEPGEVRLIGARLDGWVDGLRRLGLDLDGLRSKVGKPVRCQWVVHGEDVEDCWRDSQEMDGDGGKHRDVDAECNLLVLCSASRRVVGAEMSEDGYIQGAGDDAEGWSGGLTPAVFWQHKDELLNTPEEDLQELVARLVREEKMKCLTLDVIQVKPTNNLFIAVAAAESSVENLAHLGEFDLVVDCNGKTTTETTRTLNLGCRSGKLGSRDLREKLVVMHSRVVDLFQKSTDSKVLVVCETGKDLSIGAAVTLLCLLYNDSGQVGIANSSVVDKILVKKRLAWITAQKPDANPSRSTLQAVNSFLIGQPL